MVEYRKSFVQWGKYEKRMVTYDNDGNANPPPNSFVPQTGQFRLILVTHDESMFYANDRHKKFWSHKSDPHAPGQKGEGPSLMISVHPQSTSSDVREAPSQVCSQIGIGRLFRYFSQYFNF